MLRCSRGAVVPSYFSMEGDVNAACSGVLVLSYTRSVDVQDRLPWFLREEGGIGTRMMLEVPIRPPKGASPYADSLDRVFNIALIHFRGLSETAVRELPVGSGFFIVASGCAAAGWVPGAELPQLPWYGDGFPRVLWPEFLEIACWPVWAAVLGAVRYDMVHTTGRKKVRRSRIALEVLLAGVGSHQWTPEVSAAAGDAGLVASPVPPTVDDSLRPEAFSLRRALDAGPCLEGRCEALQAALPTLRRHLAFFVIWRPDRSWICRRLCLLVFSRLPLVLPLFGRLLFLAVVPCPLLDAAGFLSLIRRSWTRSLRPCGRLLVIMAAIVSGQAVSPCRSRGFALLNLSTGFLCDMDG